MPWPWVDRLGLSAEPLGTPGVEDDPRRCMPRHLVDSGEGAVGPRADRAVDGGSGRGTRLDRPVPGLQATVEQRCLLAEDAQHPDQPAGAHSPAVVVGHDCVVGPYAESPECVGEVLGRGKRVAAGPSAGRCRHVGVEVDEDRPGNVSGLVGLTPRPPVEVPAHVAEHEVENRDLLSLDDHPERLHPTMLADRAVRVRPAARARSAPRRRRGRAPCGPRAGAP